MTEHCYFLSEELSSCFQSFPFLSVGTLK